MKKYLQMSREGFTLVELMVVVAIIGVLASIALPQYAKFTAKSRQSEVRLALGSVYTIEQSFATEQSTYSNCIGSLGFNRDGAKFYYAIASAAGGATCGPTGGQPCLAFAYTYTAGAGNAGAWAPASQCQDGIGTTRFDANISDGAATGVLSTTAQTNTAPATSQTTFTVGAEGKILSNSANTDRWTINQGKNLVNTMSGIAN